MITFSFSFSSCEKHDDIHYHSFCNIVSFFVNQIFRNNTADLYNIFNASVNIWNDDMKSYFYAISIGAVGFAILTILISSRILRKVKKND